MFAGGADEDDWATAITAAVRIRTVGKIKLMLSERLEKDLKLLTP